MGISRFLGSAGDREFESLMGTLKLNSAGESSLECIGSAGDLEA